MRRGIIAGIGAVAASGIAVGALAASRRGADGDQRMAANGEPPDEPQPEAPVELRLEPGVEPERFLRHLAGAIEIKTVSHEGAAGSDVDELLRLHAHLAAAYPLAHEQLDRETVNRFSLLYTWTGRDAKLAPIVLMAHLDVVPVDIETAGDWDADPFGGDLSGEYIWGRGAIDDKGALIAIFEAIEHLLGSGFTPERTVLVVAGHDEEVGGGAGGARIAALLSERDVHPWFVVDEGGSVVGGMFDSLLPRPVALVGISEKGYLNLLLTARAEGGHSSLPPRSTAIGVLAAAVAALEANPVPARPEVLRPTIEFLAPAIDPRLGDVVSRFGVPAAPIAKVMSRKPRTDALIRTTTAATMVEGGVKPNALPQVARATVNFRILPGDSIASVVGHVRSLVGRDIAVEILGPTLSEPSAPSSTESAGWQVVARTIEETFPDTVVAPWVFSGATDSRFFTDIADDVYRFAPFRLNPDLLSGIHGVNERIRVADATAAVSFFSSLIRNATG